VTACRSSLLVTWMLRGLAASRTGMVRVNTPTAILSASRLAEEDLTGENAGRPLGNDHLGAVGLAG